MLHVTLKASNIKIYNLVEKIVHYYLIHHFLLFHQVSDIFDCCVNICVNDLLRDQHTKILNGQ